MDKVNMGQNIERGVFDTKRACEYLCMNRKGIDSLRNQNIIKFFKVGKKYYYPKSELDAFINESEGKYIPYYA